MNKTEGKKKIREKRAKIHWYPLVIAGCARNSNKSYSTKRFGNKICTFLRQTHAPVVWVYFNNCLCAKML